MLTQPNVSLVILLLLLLLLFVPTKWISCGQEAIDSEGLLKGFVWIQSLCLKTLMLAFIHSIMGITMPLKSNMQQLMLMQGWQTLILW